MGARALLPYRTASTKKSEGSPIYVESEETLYKGPDKPAANLKSVRKETTYCVAFVCHVITVPASVQEPLNFSIYTKFKEKKTFY